MIFEGKGGYVLLVLIVMWGGIGIFLIGGVIAAMRIGGKGKSFYD